MLLRTIAIYFGLIIAIRFMGKRQVGQMEPSEFVVTMLLANLAAVPFENRELTIWDGLAPMAIVFLCERGLSLLALKSIRMRRLLCGKPVILIENGRLLQTNLRRTRVNLDELTAQLREAGILEIETVQFAILETNGALSVFPFPAHAPVKAGPGTPAAELPYTIISDGRVLERNLRLLGRDRAWLDKTLHGKSCKAGEVFLMTLTASGQMTLFRRDKTANDHQISW